MNDLRAVPFKLLYYNKTLIEFLFCQTHRHSCRHRSQVLSFLSLLTLLPSSSLPDQSGCGRGTKEDISSDLLHHSVEWRPSNSARLTCWRKLLTTCSWKSFDLSPLNPSSSTSVAAQLCPATWTLLPVSGETANSPGSTWPDSSALALLTSCLTICRSFFTIVSRLPW